MTNIIRDLSQRVRASATLSGMGTVLDLMPAPRESVADTVRDALAAFRQAAMNAALTSEVARIEREAKEVVEQYAKSVRQYSRVFDEHQKWIASTNADVRSQLTLVEAQLQRDLESTRAQLDKYQQYITAAIKAQESALEHRGR